VRERGGRVGREDGQALVEFALVLPLLLLLLFGIIEFGLALNRYLSLNDAVRAGARELALGRGLSDPCDPAVGQTLTNANSSGNTLTSSQVTVGFSAAPVTATTTGTTTQTITTTTPVTTTQTVTTTTVSRGRTTTITTTSTGVTTETVTTSTTGLTTQTVTTTPTTSSDYCGASSTTSTVGCTPYVYQTTCNQNGNEVEGDQAQVSASEPYGISVFGLGTITITLSASASDAIE